MKDGSDGDSVKFENIFYGTRIPELGFKIPIDPDYNAQKVFEYGNGVYFTNDVEIAKAYIIRDSIKNFVKSSSFTPDTTVTAPRYKQGNLHSYKLNYDEFKNNEEYKEAFAKYKFKKELEESIAGYKKYGIKNGYKPSNRYFTSGILAGKPWDTFWDAFFRNPKGKLELISEKDINKLIELCVNQATNDNQICIHKRSETINETEIEMKYFDKRYFEYNTTIPVEYIEI